MCFVPFVPGGLARCKLSQAGLPINETEQATAHLLAMGNQVRLISFSWTHMNMKTLLDPYGRW